MTYVSTDPTGHPLAHLVAMDINQLINALKNDADALLVESRTRQTRKELDTSTGLLKYLQEMTNARESEIHGIKQRLIACQK
ncbi:hypothetical protein RclHR1_22500001 [Rhizophagus clarus]|uniref:Uncharacterized protein n=1 Tax=Rhizophagus clarus TaxID=94130 RepID=A0A2Z6R806_9GLOM|nr:hypothetical protein RclHR1_22500001 [Rhizophagus clarus]